MQTTHKEVVDRVAKYLMGSPRGRGYEMVIRRSPVVAAMYETFGKLPSKANEFWDVVRDGVGADVQGLTDPRIKLHNSLRESIIGQGVSVGHSASRLGKKSVPGEAMYRWCITSWNAWRKGETLTLLRASTGDTRPKAR